MSILHNIEDYVLGKKEELIKFDTREVNIAIFNHMSMQCQKNLYIISRKFDPLIFGTKDFVTICKDLALSSRKMQIKIIVSEPETIIKHRHALLPLATRLNSSILLRKCHESFSHYNACMVINDDTGYIYRENESTYTGTANFQDRNLCKKFLKQFTDMWELAKPDSNLRQVYI